MHKDMSQTDLAKRIGVTKGEISRLEGGSRRFTAQWLDKCAKAMNIDAAELLRKPSGISDALSTTDVPAPRTGRTPLPRPPVMLKAKIEDAAALGGALIHGVRATAEGHVVHEIFGDEMAPTLNNGEGAIVDIRHTKPTPSGVFLITEMGADVVRRIQLLPATGLARVSADHPSFENYEVSPGDLKIVGRVIGKITSL